MKKNLSMIFAVILLVSLLLSGCSGNKGTNNEAASADAAQTSNVTAEPEKKTVDADPTAVAVVKEFLQNGNYSMSELTTAMSKVSFKQEDTKKAVEFLEVDFSIQALRAAKNLFGGKFSESRVETLLGNSGYSASEISFAMENLKSDGADAIIEEEMAKYKLTDEEKDLLAAFHGN